MSCTGKKFIVVGGGIGGLAAAVALSQQGVHVTVSEQATELGEIGAGVEL
ncbi:MAG: 3-hydroxybenzoate-6-hydroxylase, partial [Pseudomonadota bacterium]